MKPLVRGVLCWFCARCGSQGCHHTQGSGEEGSASAGVPARTKGLAFAATAALSALQKVNNESKSNCLGLASFVFVDRGPLVSHLAVLQ